MINNKLAKNKNDKLKKIQANKNVNTIIVYK